jgi:tetratricopeptide (TPR) repeat protein
MPSWFLWQSSHDSAKMGASWMNPWNCIKRKNRSPENWANKDGLQRSLGNQALILQMTGSLEEAMELFKEQERICREMGSKKDLQSALGNQALLLRTWGRLDEAMQLLQEQEVAYRELGDKDGLQRSLATRR